MVKWLYAQNYEIIKDDSCGCGLFNDAVSSPDCIASDSSLNGTEG
jgi:hypothetical protein